MPNYTPGLYTPDQLCWEINANLGFNLALGRALLLEVAHPLIAAGVVDHSDYDTKPLQRLIRTALASMVINYGSAAQLQCTSKRYHQAHRKVSGILREDAGRFPAGTAYDGADPELRLWVYAASVDSILMIHEHLTGPLTEAQKATYYEEGRSAAQMLGITKQVMPVDYEAFQQYMEEMLGSDYLAVGTDGRNIVEALFSPTPIGLVARTACEVGIGFLPPRLREGFGFGWTTHQEKRLERIGRLSRLANRVIPRPLLSHPYALWNELRWRLK